VRTRRTDQHLSGDDDGASAVRTRPGAGRGRIVRGADDGASWLVSSGLEREHMLDLNARLRVIFVRCAVVAFLSLVVAVPWFGWMILPAPLIAAAMYHLVQRNIERYRRPEYLLVAAWLIFQVGIAIGFAGAEGSPVFALALFTIMVPGMSAIFPRRGVIVGTAFTALLIIACGVAFDTSAVTANPAVIAFPLALLGTVALIGSAIGRSAFSYRGASVVDQLTGMLNRAALNTRVAELAARAELSGEDVAVIVGDLDRFKTVNDEHGHSVGDQVLQAIAQRMRGCLRTFESAYRIGGEEFAVLLNGVEAREAGAVAERLREAVRREPVEGLRVTMSFGVAALGADEEFDEDALFARADAALYRAKASGRDRVCLDAVAAGEAGAVGAATT
jgi:diguanylate cyclase (GGDEF)-like protein